MGVSHLQLGFSLFGLCLGMPTDAERWRFLVDHQLTLHTDGGDYLVHWCRYSGPGEPPKFFPVSTGRTADEAVDAAMARYERKQRRLRGMDDGTPSAETTITE
jgi:hypothetical protein